MTIRTVACTGVPARTLTTTGATSPTTTTVEPILRPMLALASPFFGGGYVPVAAVNAAVADPAVSGAAADVGDPGGAIGAAHHDDDVIAGIWPDGDE